MKVELMKANTSDPLYFMLMTIYKILSIKIPNVFEKKKKVYQVGFSPDGKVTWVIPQNLKDHEERMCFSYVKGISKKIESISRRGEYTVITFKIDDQSLPAARPNWYSKAVKGSMPS